MVLITFNEAPKHVAQLIVVKLLLITWNRFPLNVIKLLDMLVTSKNVTAVSLV